jgi:hypothetical protein
MNYDNMDQTYVKNYAIGMFHATALIVGSLFAALVAISLI